MPVLALCVAMLTPQTAATAADPATLADRPAVEAAWSRPALEGRVGVLYLTMEGGAQDDRLVQVGADVAAKAELHRSFDDHGIMRMRSVDAIDVPAGKTVRLAPDGDHVMLVSLVRALRQGDRFSVTLRFEKAGRVEAVATVRGSDGSAAPMQGMTMPSQQPPPR